jgi:hypothetical protein
LASPYKTAPTLVVLHAWNYFRTNCLVQLQVEQTLKPYQKNPKLSISIMVNIFKYTHVMCATYIPYEPLYAYLEEITNDD